MSKRLHAGPHMVGSRADSCSTELNRNRQQWSTLSLNMKVLLQMNVTKDSYRERSFVVVLNLLLSIVSK